MDAIKLESDLRLETIFISITKNTLNKLNDLSELKELDIVEKSNINKFIYLTNQTNDKLSIDTLITEFPDLYFNDSTILSGDQLNDYINMYINYKKNLFTSKKLFNLANLIRTNGITEDILNQLNSITKSDSVAIEHSNIEDNILEIYKNKTKLEGIKTGVDLVDKDTGGLQQGSLTTILGFTGSFKTTWAINIAYNAIKQGKNVLYLSLEVIGEYIYYDLLSRHSSEPNFKYHIEHEAFKKKELSDNKFDYVENFIYPDFKKFPGKIYIVDETELEAYSFYSLETKFREIDKLAIEATGHGIDLLVIDHAQLLKFDASMKGIGNETNIVNAYVSFFRQNALNWIKSGRQISVLVLSQASREGWKEAVRANGKYKLTALAEANELERASSLVLSVYSSDALKEMKEAKVQILKNRDGQVWTDPAEIYVEPAYYIFGDNQNGTSPSIEFNTTKLSDLIDIDEDDSILNTNNIDINNIDLSL